MESVGYRHGSNSKGRRERLIIPSRGPRVHSTPGELPVNRVLVLNTVRFEILADPITLVACLFHARRTGGSVELVTDLLFDVWKTHKHKD